jgi:hypothetical protein
LDGKWRIDFWARSSMLNLAIDILVSWRGALGEAVEIEAQA